MEQRCCVECGSNLRASEAQNGKKRCMSCICQSRVAFLLTDGYMSNAFSKMWVRELFKKLGTFLERHQIPVETRARMLSKTAIIFKEADTSFRWPEEMHEEWLEGMIKKMGRHFASSFFKAFLVEEHIVTEEAKDEKALKALQARIEHIPQEYQRLLEIFLNERITLRERQIKQYAKRPLAVRTIVSDFEILSRLVRWLVTNMPDLTGWEMVQEEHIHAFLLTLTPKHREPARKDLHMVFRLARRRRIITHVPIMDYPAKELPPTVEPLRVEEQQTLAQRIRESIYTSSEEAFLSALCFYHGLSSSQICHIKTTNVDVERGMISVGERPPIYLLAEDFLLLEQFLRKRKELPYAKSRSHLFISNNYKLDDEPLGKGYVLHKVRTFTGHTPQRLRITCFTALSARFGPQYLVEAFGLSLTQASRYGNLQEFLLEEEIKQQREEFLELSRQLGQDEKQHTPRSHRKKEEVKQSNAVSKAP
jgi:hypothetical protein